MDDPDTHPPKRPWLRPLLLVGGLAVLAGGLKASGVEVEPDAVVGWVRASGPWGLLVFVALVVVFNLFQVPAWIFVVAAGLIWPLPVAFAVAYGACVLAAVVTFEVFGRAGGTALRGVERPWMQKVLRSLDAQPVRGVALLRAVFMATPPITVALALAGVRRRDHLLGTLIGISFPMVLILLVSDLLREWWDWGLSLLNS